MCDKKEVKWYLGKESFEHRKEMEENTSPEDQAIYWMNKGRELTLKEIDAKYEALEKKFNEVINKINFISLYYECKGDYAGHIRDLEVKKNE